MWVRGRRQGEAAGACAQAAQCPGLAGRGTETLSTKPEIRNNSEIPNAQVSETPRPDRSALHLSALLLCAPACGSAELAEVRQAGLCRAC